MSAIPSNTATHGTIARISVGAIADAAAHADAVAAVMQSGLAAPDKTLLVAMLERADVDQKQQRATVKRSQADISLDASMAPRTVRRRLAELSRDDASPRGAIIDRSSGRGRVVSEIIIDLHAVRSLRAASVALAKLEKRQTLFGPELFAVKVGRDDRDEPSVADGRSERTICPVRAVTSDRSERSAVTAQSGQSAHFAQNHGSELKTKTMVQNHGCRNGDGSSEALRVDGSDGEGTGHLASCTGGESSSGASAQSPVPSAHSNRFGGGGTPPTKPTPWPCQTLSADSLRDDCALWQLFRTAVEARLWSIADLQGFWAGAEQALRVGQEPQRLFVSNVRKGKRHGTDTDHARAQKRLFGERCGAPKGSGAGFAPTAMAAMKVEAAVNIATRTALPGTLGQGVLTILRNDISSRIDGQKITRGQLKTALELLVKAGRVGAAVAEEVRFAAGLADQGEANS